MPLRHKTHTGLNTPEALPGPKISGYLLKIFAIIFPEFLIMGISLGVLPAYVHNQLLFSNLVVGVVIGTQYAATLCTRHFAGRIADTKGGRVSATTGLIFSSLSAVFCLLSSAFSGFLHGDLTWWDQIIPARLWYGTGWVCTEEWLVAHH